MTGDYLSHDAEAVAITQAERDWFRDNLKPPDNWKIWIGRYQGNKGIWTHYVVPILGTKDIVDFEDNTLSPPDTQATTFVIGQLCVHVLSSSGDPTIVTRWNWPFTSRIGLNLPRIFPPKEAVIVWPPNSLSEFEIELVSTTFERVIEIARRSIAGRRLV